MRSQLKFIVAAAVLISLAAVGAYAADAKAATVSCVGIYSETDAGYISWRTGSGAWTPVKVGDVLSVSSELKVNVDRDWVEFVVTGKPEASYEVIGPESGEKIVKISDVIKGKARNVSFPKGTAAKPDGKYKDKLVVTQYLGRQIYVSANGDSKDVKYGDVLDGKGKVKIIAINNTLTLMNASSGVTTVIGPLNFNVEQVLTNKSLYKYLNVQK